MKFGAHIHIVVGNDMSDFKPVKSGVPQGSVLGPLLFILYINDLPDNVVSMCKIFADDTKIYSNTLNQYALQQDIYSLFNWSRKWQFPFNAT